MRLEVGKPSFRVDLQWNLLIPVVTVLWYWFKLKVVVDVAVRKMDLTRRPFL
jgi:hypothetical protein